MAGIMRPMTAPAAAARIEEMNGDVYEADMDSSNANFIVAVRCVRDLLMDTVMFLITVFSVRPESEKERMAPAYHNVIRVVNSNILVFDPADERKTTTR